MGEVTVVDPDGLRALAAVCGGCGACPDRCRDRADDEPDAGLLAQHLEHDTYMRIRGGPNFQQRLDSYIAELDAKAQRSGQ